MALEEMGKNIYQQKAGKAKQSTGEKRSNGVFLHAVSPGCPAPAILQLGIEHLGGWFE